MNTTEKTQSVENVSKEVANAAKELENIRGFVSHMKKREEELRKIILAELEIGQDGYYEGHKVVAVNPRNNPRLNKSELFKAHPEVEQLMKDFTEFTVNAVVETF